MLKQYTDEQLTAVMKQPELKEFRGALRKYGDSLETLKVLRHRARARITRARAKEASNATGSEA